MILDHHMARETIRKAEVDSQDVKTNTMNAFTVTGDVRSRANESTCWTTTDVKATSEVHLFYVRCQKRV